MAEPIGALRVDVAANAAQIQSDLAAVKGIVNTASAQMQRGMETFAKGANAAINSIFNLRNAYAVLAATTLVAFIKKAVEAGDEISKTAQKIGISTDKLQELRYAANSAGVKTEDFDNALLQLSKRLGDTSGDVTATSQALGKLGISMASIKGKNTADVVALIADRIKLIPDAMQRAKISTDLFGKSGQQLLPVLMTGAAGLAQFALEAQKLGIVIDSKTLKQAEEANDEFTKIGKSLQAAGINIAVGFLPALKELRAVVTSPDFQSGVKDLATNFSDLIGWMVKNKDTIITVTTALAGMRVGAAVGGAIGGARGAVIGGAIGAAVGAGAGIQMTTSKIKDLEAEIWMLQDQLKSTAGQMASSNDPTIIGRLASKADVLKAKLAEDTAQLQELKKAAASAGDNKEIPQITISKSPGIVPVMPEADKAIEDLSFKTRILRQDFIGLADGFPELAHGLKIFGDTTYGSFSAAVTKVEQLPEPLRKLNEQLLQNNAAKTIAATRSEQDNFNIALQKLQQLQPYLTVEQYSRALATLKFPSLTRAIDDAQNFNKQIDSFSTNSLNSTADALTDIATGAKTTKQAFADLAQSVIRDLTQMIIKALLFRAVSALFGFSGGGPVDMVLGGGSPSGQGGIGHMATGGRLFGPGSGTSDSIPIMASNGEYVVNAQATRANRGLLDLINFGGFKSAPGFADGGSVGGAGALAGSNDGGPVGVHIYQSFENNFSAGINGTDRAQLSREMQQVGAQAEERAVQRTKGLSLRRSGAN